MSTWEPALYHCYIHLQLLEVLLFWEAVVWFAACAKAVWTSHFQPCKKVNSLESLGGKPVLPSQPFSAVTTFQPVGQWNLETEQAPAARVGEKPEPWLRSWLTQ